jgi:hypothetical protein
MGTIRFCDNLSRWVQPPDAENRMSGGVAEVAGAIPSPRADHGCACGVLWQAILMLKLAC